MHKLFAAFGAVFFLVSPALAGDDVPKSVKDACRGDYEKFCAMHKPESAAVRDCMADAFEKLSDPCVGAILDSSLAEEHAAQQKVAQAKGHKSKTRVSSVHQRGRSKVAQKRVTPQRVAGYIRRGTGIAERYVAKYTRLAFARAFQ